MREESLEFLKELLSTSSPSGFEEPAAEVWKEYLKENLKQHAESTDHYGNTTVVLNGNPDVCVMLCGHIDEIGLMVSYINDEGFIYTSMIGGVDRANLVGRPVTIHNARGDVQGVFGRKAAHLQDDDDDSLPKLHEMFIDIGANDKEETSDMIAIGDPVTVDSECHELLNNRLVGRGLDNRVGAWAVAEVLRELDLCDKDDRPTVFGVATVQEELGFYGAAMRAQQLNIIKYALVIDLTHTTDMPNSEKEKNGDIKLGDGPAICIGSVVNKSVSQLLREVAEENRIPFQIDIAPEYTGTDADGIFTKNGGIPTGLVSIPNRYMHSPVEMVQLDDLDNAVKLIVEWCKKLV